VDNTNIKEAVKEKYGEVALRVNTGGSACCGAMAAGNCGPDPRDAGKPGPMYYERHRKAKFIPSTVRIRVGLWHRAAISSSRTGQSGTPADVGILC